MNPESWTKTFGVFSLMKAISSEERWYFAAATPKAKCQERIEACFPSIPDSDSQAWRGEGL